MLIELKKGCWVSFNDCLNKGFVGCRDVDCYDKWDICCEECVLNDVDKLPLYQVNTKKEKMKKILIDCTEEELEEIKSLLREEGYNVI